MLVLFYFQFVVLQVSLVPKGYRQNFTFTGAKGLDEETRITLPSFLFQTKGKYVNKQFPCRKPNSSSLCKCILACAMLFLLQKIKKNGWRSKFSNFSSFLDILHLYFVHDYWFNRRTVKKYSVSSVCYSDSHFSYIPSNVCIISFPSRKIFCLHFQRLLRLMCYTEISMNFSTTWAPGNSYYRFGCLLMCIHRKKLIACPCWDLQCSPVSQGR